MQNEDKLIQRLLFLGECSSLDYKRDQYKFTGASDHEKSEILKDVIAFANSYRSEPAYILIGVKARPGEIPEVVGCTEHLDDADLQQFINAKTNIPISFTYRSAIFRNMTVGVFEITHKQRPVFATRDFGHVKQEKVYVRRGSSTGIADPTEISQMAAPTLDPAFSVSLVGPDRSSSQEELRIASILVDGPDRQSIADLDASRSHAVFHELGPKNQYFHKEFLQWIKGSKKLNPLRIKIRNVSSASAKNIRLELMAPRQLELCDEDGIAEKPERSWSAARVQTAFNRPDVQVQLGDEGVWTAVAEIERIRPREAWVSESMLFIGANEAGSFSLMGRIFGDGFEPFDFEIKVETNIKRENVTTQRLLELVSIAEHRR